MPDFEKTEKIFDQNGLKYERPMEYNQRVKFLRQVTTEEGNFRQDPNHPEEKYPKKIPTQIIRNFVLEDGKEYGTTQETWIGIDGNNNQRSINVREIQWYDEPTIEIEKSQNPEDTRTVTARKRAGRMKKRYTETFTKKWADDAYNRSNKLTVSLLLKEVGRGKPEEVVKDFNEFANGGFYDVINHKPSSPGAGAIEKKVVTSQKREVEQLAS
jgi:hypothetical protein